jgi:hypothetical protein
MYEFLRPGEILMFDILVVYATTWIIVHLSVFKNGRFVLLLNN